MPKLNGTGPTGQGPMTGRGLGPCNGGVRLICGCRGGYGYGRRFISPKNELTALEAEEQMISQELSAIRNEIVALKGQKK